MSFNHVTITKLDLDMQGTDLKTVLEDLDEAGVSLEGFQVVRYNEVTKRLTIQKVDEKKVTKPDPLFKNHATPRHTFPFERPKALPGEW